MRKKIVIGNWKMNMTRLETKSLLTIIKESVKENKSDIAFAVPFTDLETAVSVLEESNIMLGAQNVHSEPRGAYTGEISVEMLKDVGVECCIVGHSERRKYFAETDELVNKKVKALLEANILPVICVGETLEQREAGEHLDLIRTQVKKALADVDSMRVEEVIIAYEPLWAIGTGVTATTEQAEEVCSFIRYIVAEIYGVTISNNIRILYGGSVNENNAKELFAMENIDGALVGGASLKPTFVEIINAAEE
ncbi:MAG: triose-phosphate isomerase [Clostridia bacterium]|nr:triose-phosphate isomerase [Clostridia bacterium]